MRRRFGANSCSMPHGASCSATARELVHMSPKAFELLLLLTDRAPAAVSKGATVRVIWPNVDVSGRQPHHTS